MGIEPNVLLTTEWARRALAVLVWTAIARQHQQHRMSLDRVTEELMAAYLSAEPWAWHNSTDAWEAARVPGTIASSAMRAVSLTAQAAWSGPWVDTSSVASSTLHYETLDRLAQRLQKVRATEVSIVRVEALARQRTVETMAVKFVRSLLESHDVMAAEVTRREAARRIRSLRRSTEWLGRLQNMFSSVFWRGRMRMSGGVRVRRATEIEISGRCHWFEPIGCDTSVQAPTMVYAHGGGFLIGSAVTNGEMVARMAEAAGVRTLLVEYRRSPEAPFPDALLDALLAVKQLLRMIPVNRLLLAGDSAGGNLVLGVLLVLRSIGLTPLGCLLVSPLVDIDVARQQQCGTNNRLRPFAKFSPWEINNDYIDSSEEHHHHDLLPVQQDATGEGTSLRDLYASRPRRISLPFLSPPFAALVSPAAASSRQLASLGPTPILVHIGGREFLRNSICDWIERAARAGAKIKATIFADEVHVFHAFGTIAPAWPAARADIHTFVSSRLAATSTAAQAPAHPDHSLRTADHEHGLVESPAQHEAQTFSPKKQHDRTEKRSPIFNFVNFIFLNKRRWRHNVR